MRRCIAALLAYLSMAALALPLPSVAPEAAGFSAEGLARIDRFFEREMAANRVPGAVGAIARDGKLVYYKAHGYLNKSTGEKMPLDAIFNLASMTKPMAVVGGLALMEDGRLPLHSRLDEYFPQFAKMQVGVLAPTADAKPEVAKPIYIHDLMRHTSGLTYAQRGNTPVHKLYPGDSFDVALGYTSDAFLDKLATAPLLYEPGTVWEYGFSIDVLGLVIEKVTRQRLGEYLKAAVWDKVAMPDTTFHVPPEKRKRIARPFPRDPLSGKPQVLAILDKPVQWDCAGACAFGTVADYLRFGEMLLEGGQIDGHRVLSPKTVAFMTSDHLGLNIKNQVAGTEPHREGYSFGLGVAVRIVDGLASVPGTPGDFTWNGAYGTGFWAYPQERLVVVFGTVAPGELRKYYREQVQDLVYGAMTELRHPR